MKKYIRLLLIVAAGLMVSCKGGDDATNVAVVILDKSPTKVNDTATCGTKILYDIKAYSLEAELAEFTISSFDQESGTALLYENTDVGSKEFEYRFEFSVPVFELDNAQVSIFMKARDKKGENYELRCKLTVVKPVVTPPDEGGEGEDGQ